MEGCAQVKQQTLSRHFQQVEVCISRCRLKIRTGASVKLENLQIIIDNNTDRPIFIQDNVVSFFLYVEAGPDLLVYSLASAYLFYFLLGSGKVEVGPSYRRFFGINLVLFVHQGKQVRVSADSFGGSQH